MAKRDRKIVDPILRDPIFAAIKKHRQAAAAHEAACHVAGCEIPYPPEDDPRVQAVSAASDARYQAAWDIIDVGLDGPVTMAGVVELLRYAAEVARDDSQLGWPSCDTDDEKALARFEEKGFHAPQVSWERELHGRLADVLEQMAPTEAKAAAA
jgi:hypothetical protein